MSQQPNDSRVFLPDYVYTGARFERGKALVIDDSGRTTLRGVADELAGEVVRLEGRAILPGLVNAHSHAFQRVIRGRTEHRSVESKDSFWTWREMMYSAAGRLGRDDVYDASRMAFMEMALCGITSVGEFHYLHRDPEGHAYDDPNLLAKQVIRAARDVGLRIALLRVAYARAGYQLAANERQKRFIEEDPTTYLRNLDQLKSELERDHDEGTAWVGVAPHSVRAVPLDYLRTVNEYAREQKLSIHMHVAEQRAENEAAVAEYGQTPVALLAAHEILSERFTAVHAVHVTPDEARMIGDSRAIVCACPTTERNLGDGIVPADLFFQNDVRIAFGTDSHTQIDLLEDARELEYHLRLARMERNVLAPESQEKSALAARLFDGATVHGSASIGGNSEALGVGGSADFFTVDLNDPSIAGASEDDLLSNIVFSMSRSAVRDVFVGGEQLVKDGRHRAQDEIVEAFVGLQRRLWV
jgi:formimidoylglutamate deiminase